MAAPPRSWSLPTTVVSELLHYDALIIGTGATPVRPPIAGLDRLGAGEGVHLLHSMADSFEVADARREARHVERAVIVGAGYIGLEMAEALHERGLVGGAARAAARGAADRRPGARRARPCGA